MSTWNKLLGLTALVSFVAVATPAKKDWTILVFLNGNNSLDSFGPEDINEMEQVGSSDKVNVVVQWASLDSRKTLRLKAIKDNDPNKVTSPILKDMGLVDMGNADELVNFVKWGKENFPADHYFLDIWNHGNGWERKSANDRPFYRDVSWDDISGHHISTEQLGTAGLKIKDILGQNLDILGFDACLMAMGEVAGEVADSTNFLVGSQELEPGPGWAYDGFLKDITKNNASLETKDVAASLVKTYAASYTNGTQGTEDVTLSTFDLKAFVAMYPSLKNLSTALNTLAASNPNALKDAVEAAQGFSVSYPNDYRMHQDYRDLGNFIVELQKRSGIIDANVLSAVSAQLKLTVTSNATTGELTRSEGMSVWGPKQADDAWSELGTRYLGLKFEHGTNWSKWIKTLAAAK